MLSTALERVVHGLFCETQEQEERSSNTTYSRKHVKTVLLFLLG
jgi:hypothetical protein